MSHIQVKSSFVLDTLCFLEKRLLDDTKWMDENQIEEIKYFNSLLPKDFGDDYIGMSKICMIVSAFFDGDLECLSLDDLIDMFNKPKKIESTVKERITNEFTASYIYPILEWLNDEFAELYVEKLTVLKNIGLESIYKERILPLVNSEINQLQEVVAGYDADSLFKNISILRKSSIISSADIYVSFFSAPTSFTLHGGSFLTCFCGSVGTVDFYPFIAHELMHGFASEKLTDLYLKHIESDEKLKACHHAFIENWRSGNEEEFVLAAEYYLCYLSGNYSKERLLKRAKNSYGGNCPTSVAIFENLSREQDIPEDYDKWLIGQFENNQISV